MIWYLLICGLNTYKSDCSYSPPFKSQQQCEFVKRQISSMEYDQSTARKKLCVGVAK